MAEDRLRYDRMVQNAMRGVVREALAQVARSGVPGAHHFYITFRTQHPGVAVPEHLRAAYPDEMTIVLQHQFYGLEVDEDGFAVTLSFKKRLERLRIPFAAVTAFVDPSVSFGLQFQPEEAPAAALPAKPPAVAADTEPEAPQEAGAAGGDKVVSLDAFRKK